jgi:hypothetical protein
LDLEEALRRQKQLLELEGDFRKSRAAVIESKESSPVKRINKSSGKAKKKKPTLVSAALAKLPRNAAALSNNDLRSVMNLPPAGTNGSGANPNLLGALSLPTSGMNPSQDLMLEAMIRERSRIAAGYPSATDLTRRAAMFNPLNFYGTAGLMRGSNGMSLQAAAMGNQFGALFPMEGMVNNGLGMSMAGAPYSSSLGASGLCYGGSAAETFGGQASAGFQSSFAPGLRRPSAEEEAFMEVLRRKRELTATLANFGGDGGGEYTQEAKKQRGA